MTDETAYEEIEMNLSKMDEWKVYLLDDLKN